MKKLAILAHRYFVSMLVFIFCFIAAEAQVETLSANSFIVNMGATNPNTVANGLKPYGLIYDLMKNNKVPIKWIISPTKLKDGEDFNYNGVSYKGGTFIIPAEQRNAAVNAKITSWQAQGVVGVSTASPLTLNVTRTLTAVPRWTLDATNGAIAQGYLNNAGIPTTAYNWKAVAALDCCDDFYVMPHADPTWATHSRLYSWNKDCLGSIWAACHAVSALQNSINPANPAQQMNFLTTRTAATTPTPYPNNSLKLWTSHSGGSVAYTHQLPSDQVAQYMGITDAAQLNGSEQIYIPKQTTDLGGATRWNPGATIIAYDPTQADVPLPNLAVGNVAALMVYGRGFDDPTRGYVMYEAGHSHNKGSVNDVAAQRAFLNFSFFQVQPKAPQLTFSGISGGQTIAGNTTITGLTVGASSPLTGITFTYQWTSSCGGSFSSATGTTTNFTAPTIGSTTSCVISCVVTDNCGRSSFQSFPVTILGATPPTANADAQTIDPGCTNTTVTKNVLANDVEPDGQPMTLTQINGNTGSFTTANGGLVSFTAKGNITYTPALGYIGTDVLTYRVCDNSVPTNLCNNGTYTITIGNIANVPNAVNDVATIAEDAILANYNVLANDLPLVSGPITVSAIVSGPANGKVSINTDNTITYVPNADFAGTDVITYRVVNTLGYSKTANLTVTVTNDACDGGTYQTAAGSSGTYNSIPAKDTYLRSDAAGNNFGAAAKIEVDGNTAGLRRGLLQFDLSSVPAGATVTNASFKLVATAVQGATSFNISLHPVTSTSSWTEGTLNNAAGVCNWAQRAAATNWTAAGGDFGAAITSTNVTNTGTYNWTGGTLNTTISNWVNTPANNQGFLVKHTTENATTNQRKTFGDKVDIATQQPILSFDWSLSPTCAIIPARAPLALPDTVTTNSSTVLTFPVTTNDALFGQTVTALTISTAPSNGTAIVVGNNIQYTPSGTFNGVATLQYTVTTTNGSDIVKVYINVTGTPVNAIDDAPAGALSGVTQTITVKGNDIDPEGTATSTVTIATAPKNGSATVNGSGQLIYTPNANFTGNDTLFYSICETAPTCGVAYCDTARVVVVVQNRGPVATNDAKTVTPCIANTINVIGNDTDPEGNNLSLNFVSIAPVDASTIVANSDGTFTFTPQAGAASTYTVTYNVTDNGVTSQTSNNATLIITVPNYVNTAPVAVNDYADTTGMDEILFYNVKDNDSDPEGHSLGLPTVTIQPLHGAAIVLASGAVQYTPNPGFAGADTLTYRVCDQPTNPATCAPLTPLCTTANLFMYVLAPNTVVAINDENSTWVNTPVSGGVMANDFDPQGDAKIFAGFVIAGSPVTSGTVTVSGVDTTGNSVAIAGALAINADGTYTFTPANNFSGVVAVANTIQDDQTNAATSSAFLKITVTAFPSLSNSVIANNDENTTLMNTIVSSTLFGNDADPQGNSFTATSFKYDTNGDGTADATGTIGAAVTIAGITTNGAPVTNAGSLTINTNGTYTFTPANDFTGTIDVSYTITDALGVTSTAILHVLIIPDLNGALNNAPISGDDFSYANINTPVTSSFIANDNDPNANPISLNGTTIVLGGAHTAIGTPAATAKGGTIQYYADGTYTYTPPIGYTGPDSTSYTICDVTAINPQPLCNTAFIHLLIGVDNTTDAVNDENSTWIDVNVSGNVMTNDFDKQNNTQTFGSFLTQGATPGAPITSVAVISGKDKSGNPIANAGALTFAANGSYTFDPDPAFTGTVTVPYKLCDNGNQAKCDTAYLLITVDPLPTTGINTMIANNDENISYGNPVSNSLFLNDKDPQEDAFTVTSIGGGAVGTSFTVAGTDMNGNPISNAGALVINANGTYTYTPAPGFKGSINVPYTITDSNGATATAILHIDVLADVNGTQNDPPFAADDFGYTTINKSVTASFIANDSDPNANPVSIGGTTIVLGGPHTVIGTPIATTIGGIVEFYADGTYTYSPPAGYVGPDNVNYTICDVTTVAPQPLCTNAQIHLLIGPGITVSGKVWQDPDGNVIDAGATELETNLGGSLYVNLIDGSGNVKAVATVNSNGEYDFTDITPGISYSLILSIDQGVIGQPAPIALLPAAWVFTGETRNGNIDLGGLGMIDLRTYGFTNTIHFDFGIEMLPNANDVNVSIAQPVVHQFITLNGGTNPPILQGSDPEDQPVSNVLTGKTIKITTLPANAELYYDFGAGAVLLTNLNSTIVNFDPNKFQLKITVATIGAISTSFEYAYVDAAGKLDPTPALYKLSWAKVLPIKMNRFSAVSNGKQVVLNWVVSEQKNVLNYEVEYSKDRIIFSKLSTMAVNANQQPNYNFIHIDPVNGENYYRIKVVEKDGSISYSEIRTVFFGKGGEAVLIYPNPTGGNKINVALPSSMVGKQITIHIISMEGKVLRTKTITTVKQVESLHIYDLANGSYIVSIATQTELLNTKLEVIR